MSSTLAERIVDARREAGLTQEQVARRVPISRQAVSAWETGQTLDLKSRHLLALARVLNVSAHWLRTGRGPRHERGGGESAPEAARDIGGNKSGGEAAGMRQAVPMVTSCFQRRVPVVGTTSRGAERKMRPIESGDAFVEQVAHDLDYALRVDGDEMVNRFKPGDVVIVSGSRTALVGNYVAVHLRSGEHLLRTLAGRSGGMVMLDAENRYYPRRAVPESEIESMAPVVGIALPEQVRVAP